MTRRCNCQAPELPHGVRGIPGLVLAIAITITITIALATPIHITSAFPSSSSATPIERQAKVPFPSSGPSTPKPSASLPPQRQLSVATPMLPSPFLPPPVPSLISNLDTPQAHLRNQFRDVAMEYHESLLARWDERMAVKGGEDEGDF